MGTHFFMEDFTSEGLWEAVWIITAILLVTDVWLIAINEKKAHDMGAAAHMLPKIMAAIAASVINLHITKAFFIFMQKEEGYMFAGTSSVTILPDIISIIEGIKDRIGQGDTSQGIVMCGILLFTIFFICLIGICLSFIMLNILCRFFEIIFFVIPFGAAAASIAAPNEAVAYTYVEYYKHFSSLICRLALEGLIFIAVRLLCTKIYFLSFPGNHGSYLIQATGILCKVVLMSAIGVSGFYVIRCGKKLIQLCDNVNDKEENTKIWSSIWNKPQRGQDK